MVENPTPWKLYDYAKKKAIKEFKTITEAREAITPYCFKSGSPLPKVVPVYCPHIPPAEYVRRQRPFSEALK